MTTHSETTVFHLQDMCCADEERCVRTRLESIEGIGSIKFDLLARNVIIHHSCPQHVIADSLSGIGFPPRLIVEIDEPASSWKQHQLLILTCTAGAFLLAGLLGEYAHAPLAATRLLFM